MDDQKSERKQASSYATLQNVHETIESEEKKKKCFIKNVNQVA